MCEIISKLSGMTPKTILGKAGQAQLFPVDIAEICYRLGIYLLNFDGIGLEESVAARLSSAAVAKGNELAILYNQNLPTFERRLAIARELAHVCLYMKPDDKLHLTYTGNDHQNSQSRNIDDFAGNLLLPTHTFLRIADVTKAERGKTDFLLSMKFMAPETLIRQRMSELGIQ